VAGELLQRHQTLKEVLEMAKDAVCGMTVDEKAPLRSTHAGQNYVFCSPSCKTKFDKEPARYAAPAAKEVQKGKKT
jgi:Cu+-exporting ATPase